MPGYVDRRPFELPANELARLRAVAETKRCAECRRLSLEHFPWCSKAPEDVRRRWAIRAELRAKRTIRDSRAGGPSNGAPTEPEEGDRGAPTHGATPKSSSGARERRS